MNDFLDIDQYKSPKILIPNKIFIFTIIMIVSFVFFLSLLFVKFEYFYKGIGIVNNKNVIETKINFLDTNKILGNEKIIINNKNYNYKIINVSKPSIDSENIPYQNINLSVNKLNTYDDLIVEFKIKYDIKSGFEIIKELVLGKGN